MLKSYLITGYRNILRHATPSIINIIGLSVAIGCAVLIFVLADSYYNLDSMHKKANRIALIVNHVKEGDNIKKIALSPHPLADLLKENSAIEQTVRANRGNAFVRNGEKVFAENILFADAGFLDVFDFELTAGDKESLNSKNKLLITQEMALKYFGNDAVVGQVLSFKFNDEVKQELIVGGVLKTLPANSSMYFDFVLSSALWEDMNKNKLESWGNNTNVTFALFKDKVQSYLLNSTFTTYKANQNQSNPTHPIQEVICIPLLRVAVESFDITGSLSWSNNPGSFISMAIIGTILLLLACFNYMNVAVSAVSTRLKEIGIRKVIGGGKKEIIFQFLAENFLLCTAALLLGVALAYFIFVPGFDALFPIKVAFEISSWQNGILFFGGLLMLIALLSGAYPAFYVSSFNAVSILKGKEKFGGKSRFSKVLLALQFTLSVMAVVSCLTFVWSSYYFQSKDWGYDQTRTVAVKLQKPIQFEEMRSSIGQNREITSYAGAASHIGKTASTIVLNYENKEYSSVLFPVGFNYLETMNLRLKEGRFFDEQIESDIDQSAVVNESFVKKMGWAKPLEESFVYDSVKYYVIGVVQDFNYDAFYKKIEPVVFTITDKLNFKYLVAKGSSVSRIYEDVKKEWRVIAPDDPFEGFYQADVFNSFMSNLEANNAINLCVSVFAVLLSAMGLYGLVSYNLTRRLREFSVRKVFGANTFQIFKLMNKDYLWMLILAIGLGAPLGTYFMSDTLTQLYPERIPFTIMPNVICISLMLFSIGLTILSQLRRVVYENPVDTLKQE